MLFQDKQGGLELKDPATQTFLRAKPKDGALILNVGDMLQRFSNGMRHLEYLFESRLTPCHPLRLLHIRCPHGICSRLRYRVAGRNPTSLFHTVLHMSRLLVHRLDSSQIHYGGTAC